MQLEKSENAEGGRMKHTIYTHINSSSFVAITKVNKSTNRGQCLLWMSFTLLMIILLVVSVVNTITVYLQYGKSDQHILKMHKKADFPAFTVCSRSPFSKNAVKKWHSGGIMAPIAFSRKLRKAMRESLEQENPESAHSYFYADSISTYYTLLTHNETIELSHELRKLFRQCVVNLEKQLVLVNSMDDDNPCDLEIKRISHPNYFNCFVFQVKKEVRGNVTGLSLLVDLASTLPLNHPDLQGSLSGGIHEQADGIRVVIHENDHRPDIDQNGIDIKSNNKVEFVFKVSEYDRLSTPNDICLATEEVHNRTIMDLDTTFEYNPEDCVMSIVNKQVIKKCKCVYPYYIRPQKPSADVPYCAYIFNATGTIRCLMHEKFWLLDVYSSQCIQRCHFVVYDSHVSYSEWTATPWQLKWWDVNLEAIKLSHQGKLRKNSTENLKVMQMLKTEENMLSEKTGHHGQKQQKVHLTLKRGSPNLNFHKQKLLMTFTEMVSQIGGLLGLYLGLSTAFLVELIDLLASAIDVKRNKNRQK